MTTMDTWDGRSNALRLAGLAGILSIGLGIAGVFVDQMETFPGSGSTAAEISFVTLLLAGFTSFFVLVYRGAESSDAKLLYDLAFGLLAMSGAPTALALGSYAARAIRADTLPNWTASLAALAAVAHIALLASFLITDGFFSLEGGVIIAIPATLFAWILGTSVAMKAAVRSEA